MQCSKSFSRPRCEEKTRQDCLKGDKKKTSNQRLIDILQNRTQVARSHKWEKGKDATSNTALNARSKLHMLFHLLQTRRDAAKQPERLKGLSG
jgi:hypothetical protein